MDRERGTRTIEKGTQERLASQQSPDSGALAPLVQAVHNTWGFEIGYISKTERR